MDSARSAALHAGDAWATPAGDAWRHAVRVRAVERGEPAGPGRWRHGAAWIIAFALHLLLLIAARHAMHAPAPGARDTSVEVRLIEPGSPPVSPAPISMQPARAPAPHRAVAAPAPGQPAARNPEPAASAAETAPALRLFDRDGGASIPDDLAERLDRAQAHAGFPQAIAPSPLLATKRPLKLRPNHFARYWAGSDGRPLHETIWRYVTATREFSAPWGGKWSCAWVLIVVACADVPDKPWSPPQTWKPATEFDEY